MTKKINVTVRDIAQVGLMAAMIEGCEIALSAFPNVKLTAFWVIIFSLYFKNKIFFVIPIYILIEGAIWGFGIWWFMYIYTWPLLACAVKLFHKMDSALSWSLLSGVFGLSFGFLCSFPYMFTDGFGFAFGWWVSGIPWDITHGVANFFIMLVLYRPVTLVVKKIAKE